MQTELGPGPEAEKWTGLACLYLRTISGRQSILKTCWRLEPRVWICKGSGRMDLRRKKPRTFTCSEVSKYAASSIVSVTDPVQSIEADAGADLRLNINSRHIQLHLQASLYSQFDGPLTQKDLRNLQIDMVTLSQIALIDVHSIHTLRFAIVPTTSRSSCTN